MNHAYVSGVRDNERNLAEGIYFHITRPNKTREGLLPPTLELAASNFRNTDASKLQYITHEVKVAKADSSLTIEFYPHNFTSVNSHIVKVQKLPNMVAKDDFVILLSFERIPTAMKFQIAKIVSHDDMEWKESDMGDIFYEWYVGTGEIGNRTGRWYMSTMVLDLPSTPSCSLDNYEFADCLKELNIRSNATQKIRAKLEKGTLSRTDVTSFKGDYSLRTYTSGCYFYSRSAKAWIADNTQVNSFIFHETSRFSLLNYLCFWKLFYAFL